MTNLFHKFHIHSLTIFLFMGGLLTGYIKYILAIFAIVIIHELGHVFMASIMHRKIVKIEILPFGGYMKIDALISENIWEDLLIAIGGIMSQVLLGIVIYWLHEVGYLKEDMFKFLNTYNIFIISFNLLPICPLDGYKMIELLSEIIMPYKLARFVAILTSFTACILFIILNWQMCLNNIFVIIFLLFMSVKELKLFKILCWRFYVERMNHDFCYARKDIQNIDYMYKNRVNYIHGKHEKQYLREYFTSKCD